VTPEPTKDREDAYDNLLMAAKKDFLNESFEA
jgi:hypothetical protein